MRNQTVTVVIPTYNRAHTIERAVDSVLNQTWQDFAIIVVDDGSTDNTRKVMERYRDEKRVTYLKHETNKGACAARNTGIQHTKTPYIAFLDSDDKWLPEKLEKQMDFIEHNNCDVTFCSVLRIDKNGTSVYPDSLKEGDLHKLFLRGNFISTGMLLGKTHCFKILFDESLPRLQDWDMGIRLSRNCIMKHQPTPLAEYYIQADSISMNHEKLYQAARMIYDKYSGEFAADEEAMANICEQIAIAMIMTDRRGTAIWLKKARNYRKTKKNTLMYIGCLLGMQKVMKRYENHKLRQRCKS